jgi:predicted flap endonuclease-1-like 5' DNA nuclease
MADPTFPAATAPDAVRESFTGVHVALHAQGDLDASADDTIELCADDLIYDRESRARSGIPPLPAARRAQYASQASALSLDLALSPPMAAASYAWFRLELERVMRLQQKQARYVAELERVLAQRSQELLDVDEREAALVRILQRQTLRVGELERKVREQAERIQELHAALPPRRRVAGAESELLRIRGIGPNYARALDALGCGTLAAIAALSDADVARIASQLRIRNGRIQRERWVAQAQALMAQA